MKASIIIPTYNRAKILKECLEALGKQSVKDFEVIVVDDGGSDNTKEIVDSARGLKTRYFRQKHSQQGVARNKGIKKAIGEYIFFIGDDILPEKNWIEEHLRLHEENNDISVLGLTLWHPELEVNDFMKYLAPNGPQFNYGLIKDFKNCGWQFYWTSNISTPRKLFKKELFDENFRGWGYEDLELGYRLEKNGAKIVFNPKARAYHYHYYNNPESFLEKQKDAAKNATRFVKIHPELASLIKENRLKSWQRGLLSIYSAFPLLKKISVFKPVYWKLKRRYYFEEGLKNEK